MSVRKQKLIKKHILIDINATFGSEFQESVAMSALTTLLKGWVSFYSVSHKKNYIKFEIKET